MATQYGIKFSVHLITNHFGNLIAYVNAFLGGDPSLSSNWVGVKLEVDDSAIQNSMSGFGGVIKDDEEGRWICGFSCKLTSVLLQLLN
ncbi:hypothetical protein K1719_043907 [Acacia pycnantha]|nr:hypothetical protein K1719_043907 [Acacia pycnantha]